MRLDGDAVFRGAANRVAVLPEMVQGFGDIVYILGPHYSEEEVPIGTRQKTRRKGASLGKSHTAKQGGTQVGDHARFEQKARHYVLGNKDIRSAVLLKIRRPHSKVFSQYRIISIHHQAAAEAETCLRSTLQSLHEPFDHAGIARIIAIGE